MKSKKPNPYREMDRTEGEDHPLDTIARSQIPRALTDNITIATKTLRQKLGEHSLAWLELEALLNEYRRQREEVIFNIGYEKGSLESKVNAVKRFRNQQPNPEYHILVGQIQKILIMSKLSEIQRVVALLEIVQALIQNNDSG